MFMAVSISHSVRLGLELGLGLGLALGLANPNPNPNPKMTSKVRGSGDAIVPGALVTVGLGSGLRGEAQVQVWA